MKEPAINSLSVDENQDTEITLILAELKKIQETLAPIAKTYQTVTSLGRWFMALLVFISIVLGIIVGLKNLFVSK